jgi:uncharacterized protein (DUF1800 family)
MAISQSDAAHLLRRSGFGATQAKIDELAALPSREAAVDRVLDLTLAPGYDPPIGTQWVGDQYGSWKTMTNWWIDRMRTTPTPIVEKLMLFWHGHFVSSIQKVDMGLLMGQHFTMRRYGLGSFHTLAQAISIDPAMLWYLDNVVNTKQSPQENFGRELMELFTMGPSGYTQTDVVAMTRAWTGHSVNDGLRSYLFRPSWHDTAPESLFDLVGDWDGPAALTNVLKGARAKQSSEFITAKMFSFFAYPIAATDPIVVDMASTFRMTGLDIMSLVKLIFRSPAFWSDTARYGLVRSPVEWLIAALQATGLSAQQVPAQTFMAEAGHCLFSAPDVSGWKQNDYWLTTAGMWARSHYATGLRSTAWTKGFNTELQNATPANIATSGFQKFGIVDPSPGTRAAIEAWATKSKADGDAWAIPINLTQLLLLSPDFMVA